MHCTIDVHMPCMTWSEYCRLRKNVFGVNLLIAIHDLKSSHGDDDSCSTLSNTCKSIDVDMNFAVNV